MEKPAQTSIEEEARRIRENLKNTARSARLRYFGLNLRKTADFDEYKELQPALLSKIASVLNSTLQNGGRVAIIDFPFGAENYKSRIQVVSKSSYLRQVQHEPGQIREYRIGHFSIGLFKPTKRNVPDALSLEIKDNFGQDHVYTTAWNEEEAPEKRFAVLTSSNEGWKIQLDFKMPEPYFTGEPGWKVNTDLFA